MVLVSMTLNDLWPAFQGNVIFEIEYLNILRTKLL